MPFLHPIQRYTQHQHEHVSPNNANLSRDNKKRLCGTSTFSGSSMTTPQYYQQNPGYATQQQYYYQTARYDHDFPRQYGPFEQGSCRAQSGLGGGWRDDKGFGQSSFSPVEGESFEGRFQRGRGYYGGWQQQEQRYHARGYYGWQQDRRGYYSRGSSSWQQRAKVPPSSQTNQGQESYFYGQQQKYAPFYPAQYGRSDRSWLTQQVLTDYDVPPPPPPPDYDVPPPPPPPEPHHSKTLKADVPAFKPQQKPLKQTMLTKSREYTPHAVELPIRTTKSKTPERKQALPRPEPTRAYKQNANKPSERLEAPRPLLIIVDLNGTLLYRKSRGSNFVARPKVPEFLHYLLRNHHVMIWSSAKPENVKGMCDKLFTPEQRAQLVGVWGRDTLGLPTWAYNQKVQVYKQLSWVWAEPAIQASHPDGGEWSQRDTVLIDDSVEKAASEPFNLVRLEEFEGKQEQMEADVLGGVVSYLEELRWEKDVSAYMRMLPFLYDAKEEFDWEPFVWDM